MKALDGLTERAAVTAQNIANASTPGYRPLRVTFEQALAAAAGHGASAVEAVETKVEHDPAQPSLRVDMEVATASQTAVRYAALIEVLNRRQATDALVLSGNK